MTELKASDCIDCTRTDKKCHVTGKTCFYYSEPVDNGTSTEAPIKTLTRLINWEIQRETKYMEAIRKEGGFAYVVSSSRGKISGLKHVLNCIEWYMIMDIERTS